MLVNGYQSRFSLEKLWNTLFLQQAVGGSLGYKKEYVNYFHKKS